MNFRDQTFSFVDIETTGSMFHSDRIIEVAIIKVKNNEIIDDYRTLVNPRIAFNPFITHMTGITESELEEAPQFKDVASTIREKLDNSIFVAHNVSFDYGFIERSFHELEIPFAMDMLCTVKLSRHLYPEHRRHNLDSVAQRLNFSIEHRHRAYDDAFVLYRFYQHLLDNFSDPMLNFALKKLLTTKTNNTQKIISTPTPSEVL